VITRRRSSVLGSAVFFVTAPCVVAGLVPWLLGRWRLHGSAWRLPLRVIGVALVLVGLAVLVRAFVRFAVEGRDTSAGGADQATGDRRRVRLRTQSGVGGGRGTAVRAGPGSARLGSDGSRRSPVLG